MTESDTRRTRDAERSRQAILDAAERLFAARGYPGTSLQDVGDAAGVSRGTPSYFFRSKDGLYRAVLERNFTGISELLRGLAEEAAARGATAEEELRAKVEAYMDFLIAHPTFVRLVQWEALSGGEKLREFAPHMTMAATALEAVQDAISDGAFRPVDPLHLMISITAMCWFPLSQKDTFIRALGQDPLDPRFVAERKRHIMDLVLRGITLR